MHFIQQLATPVTTHAATVLRPKLLNDHVDWKPAYRTVVASGLEDAGTAQAGSNVTCAAMNNRGIALVCEANEANLMAGRSHGQSTASHSIPE